MGNEQDRHYYRKNEDHCDSEDKKSGYRHRRKKVNKLDFRYEKQTDRYGRPKIRGHRKERSISMESYKSSSYTNRTSEKISSSRSSSVYHYMASDKSIQEYHKVAKCFNSTKKRKIGEENTDSEEYIVPKKKKKVKKVKKWTNIEDLVGSHGILVIKKQGLLYFHCYFCEECTLYEGSKQLTDHVLGKNHQREYKKDIKIRKMRAPLFQMELSEESSEQFIPNKIERKTKADTYTWRKHRDALTRYDKTRLTPSPKENHSTSLKGANKKRLSSELLKRTLENAKQYNKRFDQKKPSTIVPERTATIVPEMKTTIPEKTSTTAPEKTATTSIKKNCVPEKKLGADRIQTTLKSTSCEVLKLANELDTLNENELLSFTPNNIQWIQDNVLLLKLAAENIFKLTEDKEVNSSKENALPKIKDELSSREIIEEKPQEINGKEKSEDIVSSVEKQSPKNAIPDLELNSSPSVIELQNLYEAVNSLNEPVIELVIIE